MTRSIQTTSKMALNSLLLSTALTVCTVGPDYTPPRAELAPFHKGRVVLVIAHHADFDRRFLERRLPAFAAKHWACSRADIDWKAEGIRSSALEFVAYSLFHDGHRAANDCRATLHALAQLLPGTGRLALQALLVQARLPTWRLWARDAVIEKKDFLKARG